MRPLRFVSVVSVVAMVFAMLSAGAVVARTQAASITLDPALGPPTTMFVVTGAGFGAIEHVRITFDDWKVAIATTDGAGSFARDAKVPRSAIPGDHQVAAIGLTSGSKAMTTFLVRTDWPRFRFDDANTGFNPYENVLDPTTVVGLKRVWKFGGDESSVVLSSPVVAGGRVYVGWHDNPGSRGAVAAIDALTGEVAWTYDEGDTFVEPAPTVADGMVYVGTNDDYHSGALIALDAKSGAFRWARSIGYDTFSSPTVADGVVYIGNGISESRSGTLYAFEAKTGSLLWSSDTKDGVDSTPAVANGRVYVGSDDGRVYAFNAATGHRLWSFKTGGRRSSPAVRKGTVYVGSDDGNIYALNATRGTLRWSYPTGGFVPSSPAVANGRVYVGSYDQNVYALDAETGELVWSHRMNGPVSSSPAVANGVVYVASSDGSLEALDAVAGTLLWSSPSTTIPPRKGNGAPIVADGRVYVDANYQVRAFSIP